MFQIIVGMAVYIIMSIITKNANYAYLKEYAVTKLLKRKKNG